MIGIFYREPRMSLLLVLVIVSAGVAALFAIGRQEDPTVADPLAMVFTSAPGMEAARVEALITIPLEQELLSIPEVEWLATSSRAGMSVSRIVLDQALNDQEIDRAWSVIRDRIADVAVTFPPGVADPIFDNERAGAVSVILSLSSRGEPLPAAIIGRHAKMLAERLQEVDGSDRIRAHGLPEEEVLVEIDPVELSRLGLSVEDVARAIDLADPKVSAGALRTAATDVAIEVGGEIDGIARIATVPLATAPDGTITRVGDVATISKGARSPPENMALVAGEPAVLISARMVPGGQIDRWMADVRALLETHRPLLPAGLELDILFDQSAYTNARLKEVGLNLALGITLVVVVLFFTLGAQAAFVVSLTIPFATLASIATLHLVGLDIHQMSVTGLIAALGLLVDAAIVMVDEIRKRLIAGLPRAEAVTDAGRRLAAPLLGSTITTALAFVPMLLLPGAAGDFLASIAVAVVTMLFWSLVLAFTVTSAMAGWLLPSHARGGLLGNGVTIAPLARLLEHAVRLALRHPRIAIAYALVLPVSGLFALPTLPEQFFPGAKRDQFYIDVVLAPGSPIAATRQAVLAVDEVVRADPEVTSLAWVIGASAPAFYYNMHSAQENAPNFARGLVTTADPEATDRLLADLQERLDRVVPAGRPVVRGLVQGPPVSAPVEVRIIGPDIETLQRIGEELRLIVESVPEITVVSTTLGSGPPKLSFALDEEEVRLAGLDLETVARQLEATLEGVTGGTFLEGTEDLPVRVRAAGADRGNLSFIRTLEIVPPRGPGAASVGGGPHGVPLATLGDIELVPSDALIERREGERLNIVQAFVRHDVLPQAALDRVLERIDESGFVLPPGYRLDLGGDATAREEVIADLFATVPFVAVLAVATVIIAFQSFRLGLVTIVFCVLAVGCALLSLAVFRLPLGIQALLGVIGCVGVAVNDLLVVLTALQRDRRCVAGDREAMVEVVTGATRHILSTTITTVGGFLPLILAGGGFWPPLALPIAGGVVLATVITFFFAPPVFALVYAGTEGASTRASGTPPQGGGAEPRATGMGADTGPLSAGTLTTARGP